MGNVRARLRCSAELPVFLAALCVVALASRAGGSGPHLASCRIGQLRLSVGPVWSEETGQHTATIVVRNHHTQPCVLDGYPTLALLTTHGRELPFLYSHRGDQMITAARPTEVRLAADGTAYFAFNKYRCDLHELAIAHSLTVALPGRSARRIVALRSRPTIDYCGRAGPSALVAVSPFVRRLRDAGS